MQNGSTELHQAAKRFLQSVPVWTGEGADSFRQACERLHEDFLTVSEAVMRIGEVFQTLARRVEHINDLRSQASAMERELWVLPEETPQERHHASQLRHRAQEIRYAAEMEARAADEQAAAAFQQIMAFEHRLLFPFFSSMPQAETGNMSLSEQTRRARKIEQLFEEQEESQAPVSVEDLLALYYIVKQDTLSMASPEEIIEQDLELDGIHTEDDLRNFITTQIRINESNADLELFCSKIENQEDPRCVVYKFNQSGGLDPATLVGAGAATANVITPALKQGLTALKGKLLSKGKPSVTVAIPGGGSMDVKNVGRMLASSGEEKSKNALPDWLKKRFQEGEEFNKENRPNYEYNEVEVTVDGKTFRVDSYNPGKEIVSRKYTQFSEITEKTGISYLNEFEQKYSSGTEITSSVFNPRILQGQRLDGDLILEIPVQKKPIPQAILDAATERGIIIRDVKGKEYN